MDSFERCVYIHGNKFRINRYVCAAIDENGEFVPVYPNNLTIAAKSKYSNNFVGYVEIGEECIKISTKFPYNFDYSFIFAFVCDNTALNVFLTKPVATNASLSGMSVDIGIKDDSINNYNKVMESISAVASLLKSTALRNVESSGAFAGLFEPLPALPCKSTDETVQLPQNEEDDNYV